MVEGSNNNDHQEKSEQPTLKEAQLEWTKYMTLNAVELLGCKNLMSVSEADFQWKKQLLSIQKELLEWRKYVPIGYRFVPTDYELFKYYLLAKVSDGFILPGIFQEADVYQCHPANLPGLDKGEDFCYYFTTRHQKNENSKRPERTTKDGKGHWRMTSKITPFSEPDNTKLGRKNTLVYHLTKPLGHTKDIKTNWIMHEYVLDKTLYNRTQVASTSRNKSKQVVLCRIYERKKEPAKEEESQTKRSGGIQIRDTDDNSAEFGNEKANGTKRKQPSMSGIGNPSCNSQVSVQEASNVGETSCTEVEHLPFSQKKRSRPSPVEDNDRMSLADSTSTDKAYQLIQISPQQQENSRFVIRANDQNCELSCKMANGRLLKTTGKEQNESNICHMQEGNKSGHVTHKEQDPRLLANTDKEQTSTQNGPRGTKQLLQLIQCLDIVYQRQQTRLP